MSHRVVFVRRLGNEAEGKKWDEFMQAQQAALDAAESEGWRLVSAAPVTFSVGMASTLRGVLLYFANDER